MKTRARLLDAARALAEEAGYEELRTEAVAAAAGTAKGTLFAHFPDKDRLILALVTDHLEAASDAFERAAPGGAGALAAAIAPTLDVLSRERIVFALVQRYAGVTDEANAKALDDWFTGLRGRIAARIARMQEAGDARRDADAETLADGVLAFLLNAVMNRLCGLWPDEAAQTEALERMLAVWLSRDGG